MGFISNVKTAVKAGKKAYTAAKVAKTKQVADAVKKAKDEKDALDLEKFRAANTLGKKIKRTAKTAAVSATVGAAGGAYAYKKATDKPKAVAAKKGTAGKVVSKAVTSAAIKKATPSWMSNAANKKKFGGPVNVQPGHIGKIRSAKDQGYTAIGKREPARTSFKKK